MAYSGIMGIEIILFIPASAGVSPLSPEGGR